ncbi:DEAD/DEAH box helicase [Fervidibacillus halotolerans]|uniref:DEAD/DEAH box helicase n=1 Tax=Fervidibacillus halotolerans TaxID=2980027 RepID=A0A9E8S011_9BACI|nr:DEAD/DEAH box helicase [Fervidibacillus halotolerans]WAA13724.1 DEAD/DEAH box helicase [Fervidibacillus halotolerans]
MFKKKGLSDFIQWMKEQDGIFKNITHWETIEAKRANFVPFPKSLHPSIKEALEKKGIDQLYSHQREAYDFGMAGQDFTAITPTASGKTLCYNLPVLQTIIHQPEARALYIFPTKALSYDQKNELNELIEGAGISVNSYTYDGDTPVSVRQKIRKAGHIVITNPDMLHSGILPHHTKWVSLFENLSFVIIDELHTYRGIFGSHMANVIRRLKRICQFYGSDPVFICTSATIANPLELAEQLTGKLMKLIDQNGAPSGKKHFIFYNPPIVNQPLNIRRSATLEVRKLAGEFLKHHIQSIIFAKSRMRVEIILTYLQELVKKTIGEKKICGYRGGYLPKERREIEKGLREGKIYGVVSTNALELGVDIGQLQVCFMTGYPGTIASAWQQAGRAGRRQGESLVIFVADNSPLDQYVIQHPEYFFHQSPEIARINPDNIIILVDHLKCAAYELPFRKGERFGDMDVEDILEFFVEKNILHFSNGKYHWMNESFPAHEISLRSAARENVVIIDQTNRGKVKVIGEMDTFSALTLLHEEAIYLHQGLQYQVEKLDWEEKKAYVREVKVDYYTDAQLAVQLKVLEVERERKKGDSIIQYGDVAVTAMATIFKKIKFETHENIGSGPIHLPEQTLHTNAVWISLSKDFSEFGEQRLEEGLLGAANVLKTIVPMFVMSAPEDIHVVPQVKSSHTEKPTIFFYDRYPGGVGLSDELYDHLESVLSEAKRTIQHCPCEYGCPSCVGTFTSTKTCKTDAISILDRMMLSK